MRSYIQYLSRVLLIILILSILTGCSRIELLNNLESRDTKYFHEIMDKIFETFDTDDTEGLKNLFSVNVRSDNPDLDEQITSFFEVYNGPTEIEEIRYSTSGGERIEYGKRRTELYNSYDIIIKAGDTRYYIAVELVSRDDFDPNNEGIQTLNIATQKAHDSEYFVYYYSNEDSGGDKPGLYYQDSTEMRDDIRWIEGRPWRYTEYDRKLTIEDLVSVASRDDDYSNLVSILGEPNCSWETFSYYYYELESDLFAVCKTESINDTIRPRVDGRVERPNVIVAIYIADEEENLETVWMADDIVQVRSGYYCYRPVERELTEEFFISFVSQSTSFSQLEDEIGLPSLEPKSAWYYYYEIEENRYIECYITGDNINEISVVDKETKLYTLWEAEETEN
ncbi:DUF5104 domain-containing protein [Vallitalea guaymasensis]|uniref:DUF5104 domain-containing protein n=1 Tax=Vallitalea guaymasensis TaxID=1185412 RepID=UPI0023557136|nr:DUF5104 domain-containing protein [Vallitalea guaymasensis]